MKNILVLMAHPKLEHSKVIARLMASINGLENVEITDLYERYPDFNIDVQHEQEMLISADIVVLMHPLYWYSAPPLMKQWIDLVLEYNWAYGHKGIYLKGKYLFNAISTGGSIDAYSTEGHHGFPIKEFLLPFKQTARLCNMVYLPPFHIAGTHNITSKKLQQEINDFKALILHLRDNPNFNKLEQLPFLNDFKQ